MGYSSKPDFRQQGTLGSYGFAINAISEGLERAERAGWISDEEARDEFRSHVRSIQADLKRQEEINELKQKIRDLLRARGEVLLDEDYVPEEDEDA